MPKIKCVSPGCNGVHIPNEKTAKVLKDSEAGINVESHDNLEAFWESMWMNPNTNITSSKKSSPPKIKPLNSSTP
jgi:hypothetical protein